MPLAAPLTTATVFGATVFGAPLVAAISIALHPCVSGPRAPEASRMLERRVRLARGRRTRGEDVHHRRSGVPLLVGSAVLALVVVLSACSSSAKKANETPTTTGVSGTGSTPSTIAHPPGPAADVSEELTGG